MFFSFVYFAGNKIVLNPSKLALGLEVSIKTLSSSKDIGPSTLTSKLDVSALMSLLIWAWIADFIFHEWMIFDTKSDVKVYFAFA